MGGLEIEVEEVRNNSQSMRCLVGKEVAGRGWRKEKEVEKGSSSDPNWR
jgi:hypothetical protein